MGHLEHNGSLGALYSSHVSAATRGQPLSAPCGDLLLDILALSSAQNDKDMSRRLDGMVRERRILEAVQPIFADPLPWRLSDSHNGDGAAVASKIDIQKSADINIDKAAAFFFDDMVSVGVQLRDLPDHDLSAQSFQCCVDTITELLLFLEDLVEDDILSHPLVQTGVSISLFRRHLLSPSHIN